MKLEKKHYHWLEEAKKEAKAGKLAGKYALARVKKTKTDKLLLTKSNRCNKILEISKMEIQDKQKELEILKEI